MVDELKRLLRPSATVAVVERKKPSAVPSASPSASAKARLTPEDAIVQQIFSALSGDLLRVQDLFRSWDNDGSGTCDRDEFHQALGTLRCR